MTKTPQYPPAGEKPQAPPPLPPKKPEIVVFREGFEPRRAIVNRPKYQWPCCYCRALNASEEWPGGNKECGECGKAVWVYVDEDRDCNYWFDSEPMTTKEK